MAVFLRVNNRRVTNRRVLFILILGFCLFANFRRLATPSTPPKSPLPVRTQYTHAEPASHKTSPSFDNISPSPSRSTIPGCKAYPDNADVVIVVKTGATEAFRKIPTQLLTFLQCAKDDVLLFSDMEQELGGYHIYDSLDAVHSKAKEDNPEWDLYELQKKYRLLGADASSIDQGSDAWRLDKYKNIHTAQKAYELRPDKSWYIFIDADTYIIWPNLFLWLSRFDPEEKLYLGSKVPNGQPPFAHGGSGYLLSRAAMAELVGPNKVEVATEYDRVSRYGCCGDQELARLLSAKGINITNMWPVINGTPLRGVPLGPGADQWCTPIVTMHHMGPEEVNDMWLYELNRDDSLEPLLIENLFYDLIEPKISAYHEDWDNFSTENETSHPVSWGRGRWFSNWKSELFEKFNTCGIACQDSPDCFQYSFRRENDIEKCSLSSSIKLGNLKLPKGKEFYRSGWVLDNIARYKEGRQRCKKPSWEVDT